MTGCFKLTLITKCIYVAIFMTVMSLFGLVSCGPTNIQDTTESLPSETTSKNDGDDKASTFDPIADAYRLDSLSFDDDRYSVKLDDFSTEYTVKLPAGRSRIPRITVSTFDKGSTAEVVQAVIPDGETEGRAVIRVTSDHAEELVYTVRFVRDASLGFHLQYDDRYSFIPDYKLAAGESFVFSSSDEKIAAVDENGVVTVLDVSDSGVTVTASVNGKAVDTLKIDKTIKAPINIFLIAGQSNAEGIKGTAADSVKTQAGRAYYIDRGKTDMVDLCVGRRGFVGALCKTWYDLTGEKTVALQSAVDGSRFSKWVVGAEHFNFAVAMVKRVRAQFDKVDSKYEINRCGYFWHHGETDMSYGYPDAQYTSEFTAMHEKMKKETGASFCAFNIVRSTRSLSLAETVASGFHTDMLPVRAAQYYLNSALDDVVMISRLPERASIANGLVFEDNVHMSQKGYNELGEDMAKNLYSYLGLEKDRLPTSLEVLAYNGKDKLSEGSILELEVGTSYQIASIVLPLYCKNNKIEYSAASEKVGINSHGLITVSPTATVGGEYSVTVKGGGFSKTIKVKIKAATVETLNKVTYRWDFNNSLKENTTGTELKLSALSVNPDYKLGESSITMGNRVTDFELGMEIVLADSYDWAIEYKGHVSKCSALFGQPQSSKNFIYITPYNTYASFRLVSETGTKFDLKYGTLCDENYNEHVWRVEYSTEEKNMTLLMDGKKVTSLAAASFTVKVTNMFGRYSSGTDVCLNGEIDYVQVETYTK